MNYAWFRIFFVCILKRVSFVCSAPSFLKTRNPKAWNFSSGCRTRSSCHTQSKVSCLHGRVRWCHTEAGDGFLRQVRKGPQVPLQTVIAIWLSINLFLSEPNSPIMTPFKVCADLRFWHDLILTTYKSSDSLSVALISSSWSNSIELILN